MVIGGFIMVGTAFSKKITKFASVCQLVMKTRGETIQRGKLFKGGN